MESKEYRDDPTIPNTAELLRRVPRRHRIPDLERGCYRMSSAAFDDHPSGGPMSVLLADVMREEGRGPEAALTGHVDFSLVSITAGLARQCNQGVARDPVPNEPAHAVVFGNKTHSVRKRFADGARWVVPSSPPALPTGEHVEQTR